MSVSADQLPSWREASAKQAILEFVAAVTDPGHPTSLEKLHAALRAALRP